MDAHASPSSQQERSSVVETACGKVQGERAGGVSIFRGIPYAASTEGPNRFLPPQPRAPWAGVRACFDYGQTAPQAPTYLAEGGPPDRRAEMGEDCLCLNVWTPGPTDTNKRPVMVWFHGGGFEAGTGSSLLYDGTNLVRRGDVVLVTVNHRLGIFGHCHLGDLGDEAFAGSGNVGFLDLVAALQWVRANIAQLGGDSGNVTIFGQSGGGRKVSLLTAAPLAAGLFHRAIVQSGSHLRLMSRKRGNELAQKLLEHLGLRPSDARKLQALTWRDIRRANRDVTRLSGLRFAPVLDEHVFAAHPWEPEAPETARAIPMLIGTCRTELSNQLGNEATFALAQEGLRQRLQAFVPAGDIEQLIAVFARESPDATPSELFFKITTARGYFRDSVLQTEAKARQAGAPVYSYRLTWKTPVEGGRRISPHSLDLPFVFDNVARARHRVGPETDETRAMAHAMSESWLSFARTGNPNNESVPAWAPYDLSDRTVLLFDVPPVAAKDPQREERLAMEAYPTQQRSGVLHRSVDARLL